MRGINGLRNAGVAPVASDATAPFRGEQRPATPLSFGAPDGKLAGTASPDRSPEIRTQMRELLGIASATMAPAA
jgi:hypothetical protein